MTSLALLYLSNALSSRHGQTNGHPAYRLTRSRALDQVDLDSTSTHERASSLATFNESPEYLQLQPSILQIYYNLQDSSVLQLRAIASSRHPNPKHNQYRHPRRHLRRRVAPSRGLIPKSDPRQKKTTIPMIFERQFSCLSRIAPSSCINQIPSRRFYCELSLPIPSQVDHLPSHI